MSGWRVAVRALHEMGGSATARDLVLHVEVGDVSAVLNYAKVLGLVKSPGYLGWNRVGPWTLTPLGVDWCENRVTLVPGAPQKYRTRAPMRFVATWLSSLPRDVRIGGQA